MVESLNESGIFDKLIDVVLTMYGRINMDSENADNISEVLNLRLKIVFNDKMIMKPVSPTRILGIDERTLKKKSKVFLVNLDAYSEINMEIIIPIGVAIVMANIETRSVPVIAGSRDSILFSIV
jgi:hypothetical protein